MRVENKFLGKLNCEYVQSVQTENRIREKVAAASYHLPGYRITRWGWVGVFFVCLFVVLFTSFEAHNPLLRFFHSSFRSTSGPYLPFVKSIRTYYFVVRPHHLLRRFSILKSRGHYASSSLPRCWLEQRRERTLQVCTLYYSLHKSFLRFRVFFSFLLRSMKKMIEEAKKKGKTVGLIAGSKRRTVLRLKSKCLSVYRLMLVVNANGERSIQNRKK